MIALRSWLWLILPSMTLAACSTPRPVLYPNAQLTRVGDAAAQRDVDDCMQRAEQYVSSGGGHAAQTATETGTGAAAGATIGVVGGAITGSPGEGAAVGAATGATAGLLHSLFSGSHGPDSTYANFVERCLRERGYDPIGWR
jgi:hypothetical protein